MEVLELMYRLRDNMFAKRTVLSETEKEACLMLAALISFKVVNGDTVNGFGPDSNDLLAELHLLNHSNELFSAVPFNDREISEIIDKSCR